MYQLKCWPCRSLQEAASGGTILKSQDVEIVSISHSQEFIYIWYFVRTIDEERILQEIASRLEWHKELSEEIAQLETK